MTILTAAERSKFKDENSRLLREDVECRRTVFRGWPEVIGLHTTEKCNLRCVMCPRADGQGKLQLPRERLAVTCDQLFPAAKKVAVSAAAGEPLLADFDLVLDRALAHGVRVDVVTNGTVLTGDLYRKAAPAFDHVNVSIDCHVPEVYERVRAGGRFAHLEANLRAIAEERKRKPDGVLLSLSAVVMRSTLPHLEGLVRYARSLDVDGLILQRHCQNVKQAPAEDATTDPGPAAIRDALERVKAVALDVGQNVFVSDFGEANVMVAPVRDKVPPQILGKDLCWYLIQHFGVQPTGDVYPCCYPTDYRLGDLNRQDPLEIWNGKPARKLRAAHYSRRGTLFCSGCQHAPHLPARKSPGITSWLRKVRLRVAHVRDRVARELREQR